MNELSKKLHEVEPLAELKYLSKKYMPTEQHLEQLIGNIKVLVGSEPVEMMLKNRHCGTTYTFANCCYPWISPAK